MWWYAHRSPVSPPSLSGVSLGPGEILVVAVVALIVLGPDKLPTAARHVAKIYRELRNMAQSVRTQVDDVLDLDGTAADRRVDESTPPPNPPNPDTGGFRLIDQEKPQPPPASDPATFPPDFDAPEKPGAQPVSDPDAPMSSPRENERSSPRENESQ